jgi:hypothetical protein
MFDLCARFDRDIWLYHFEELDPDTRAEWDIHLQRCSACRQEYNDIRTILNGYRLVPDVSIDPSVVEQSVGALISPLRNRISTWGIRIAALLILSVTLGLLWSHSNRQEKLTWEAEGFSESVDVFERELQEVEAQAAMELEWMTRTPEIDQRISDLSIQMSRVESRMD